MNIKIFDTKYSQLLKRALSVYGKQHEAIAKNVAKVNDPNYKRTNTDFSQLLQSTVERSMIKATQPRHIGPDNVKMGNSNTTVKENSGKVDLTREMAELAENQIRFELVARLLNRYYNGISTSIRGRN